VAPIPKPTIKVQVGSIVDCCGAILLYSFHKHHDPYKLSDWSEYDQETYGINQKHVDAKNQSEFTETQKEYQIRIKKEVEIQQKNYDKKKSYLIVFLNDLEISSGAEEVLLSLGFEISIPRTKNPTGTAITQYVYHLLPKEAQKQKSVLKKKEISF
jgi:hypothetical protein